MKRAVRDVRVRIVFDDENGRRMPDEQHYIEVYGLTGSRPDIVSAIVTEDEALALARDILEAVGRQRSWR